MRSTSSTPRATWAAQLPAAWQESIKQGRKWTFKRFLDKVERDQTWFRAAMDLPAVLDIWGAKLPPERVHVVTVPHDRGPTGNELWLRFCRAFGVDPAWAPLDSERVQPLAGHRRDRSSYAASTVASSCRCGAMRPTTR